jgi:glycerophosphoryl diester phosphodiesterase
MKEIATYADSVGPYKLHLINVDGSGNLLSAPAVVRNAHLAKLLVIPWPFRPENNFPPTSLKTTEPATTRNPAVGRQAVDTFQR